MLVCAEIAVIQQSNWKKNIFFIQLIRFLSRLKNIKIRADYGRDQDSGLWEILNCMDDDLVSFDTYVIHPTTSL